MLSALVVSNGIGAAEAYRSDADIRYEVAEVTADFSLRLDGHDILLVPNGSDHVAMLKIRDDVRAFLERGGALFCFCGWFTNWIPGNRWVHDNQHPTKEVRHRIGMDRHGLFAGVDLAKFDHNRHGISGWWACGYIKPAPGADAVLLDTWGRALAVLDGNDHAGFDPRYRERAAGRFWGLRRWCARRRLPSTPPPRRQPSSATRPRMNHGKIGLIFNGVWSQYATAVAPKYRDIFELVYVHDFDDATVARLQALVIPFQSHQPALATHRKMLYRFLADGKKIAVFGDSTPLWLDAQWEDRPVNNYWWVENPEHPPVSETDYCHPVYAGLQPRHACWHIHGVYTRVPEGSQIIQRNEAGEIITWQTTRYGGVLFASTLDPIVEHGIQQIRHLDHYVDKLVAWLCAQTPAGRFEIDPADYGVEALNGLR